MKLLRRLDLMFVGLLVVVFCIHCSTDTQCDDACSALSSCESWGNSSCSPRGYDGCFAECKDQGDWDQPYVNCVLNSEGCCAKYEC